METMTYVTEGCVLPPTGEPKHLESTSRNPACDFSHCQARCRFVSLNAFVEREK